MRSKKLTFFLKSLSKRTVLGVISSNGRNIFGRICVHHRGGGHTFKYRTLDTQKRLNQFALVLGKLYDPNRSALLGALVCDNGFYFNIILSDGVNVGDRIFLGDSIKFIENNFTEYDSLLGYTLPIKFFSLFSIVNNIELRPYYGASFARSAGTGFTIVSILPGKICLKSSSGWLVFINPMCLCSLGRVSNVDWKGIVIRKAGISRNLGKRPVVRGVAMNPCDHPHGGGEGKKGTPKYHRTPWGALTKGPHTKNKKSDKIKRSLFKKVR